MPAEPTSRRIADQLRARMDSGEFPVGSPLPSTRVLMSEWGCARNTAREAYRILANEGRVTMSQGAATTVADVLTPSSPPLQHGTSADTIANTLRGRIHDGTYRDGQQLPSTRALAAEWATSVATITRATQLLAAEGLVDARDRSARVVTYQPTVPVPTEAVSGLDERELWDLLAAVTTELRRRSGR